MESKVNNIIWPQLLLELRKLVPTIYILHVFMCSYREESKLTISMSIIYMKYIKFERINGQSIDFFQLKSYTI
jgi:hypothetical protein